MTKPQRPILVAVRTPTRSAHPLLKKAAAMAKLYGAPLRIVHVQAIPQSSLARAGATIRQAVRADLESRSAQLEKLTRLPALQGLEVSASVRCDYPVQDALVRESLKCRARMLLAESHSQNRLARLFLSNIDWDLIRHCPCPLWLSKTARFDPNGSVIAAVDPMHAHAKPSMLDDIIVAHAVEAAGGQGNKVLLCHAYELPEGAVVDTPVEAYWIAMSEQERRAYLENLERAIGSLRRHGDIPDGNAALVKGNPAVQLSRFAKKHAAAVVVMGAVSRQGLKRVFIGNTAERVIDRLGCDVLIVKPRGFKSPIGRQANRQVVQPPRGRSLAYRQRQSGGTTHVTHQGLRS